LISSAAVLYSWNAYRCKKKKKITIKGKIK